jgi:hypothetical protein
MKITKTSVLAAYWRFSRTVVAGFAVGTKERAFMMTRRVGHRSLIAGAMWLSLISLCCVSGRCFGQTYDGFSYTVSGTNITISGYTGPAGAVTIPSLFPGVSGTVTALGDGAFSGSGLTSITIPSSVTSIGEGAFGSCIGLTNVAIPGSVTSLADEVFRACSGLTSITIPSSVTNIGDWAFWGCSGLTSLAIPSGVTSIGRFAFDGCRGLTSFRVDTQSPSYSSMGGVLFDKNQTTLVAWPPGQGGAYAIPSSVKSIGDAAFLDCGGLTSLTIPGNVTNIGDYAFSGCGSLKTVAIPSSVTSIPLFGFESCIGLTNLSIPTSVTSIEDEAFSGCIGLKTVTIPNSVTSIGPYSFEGCIGLTAFIVDTQNPSYTTLGGVLFNKNQTTLVAWPRGQGGAYTIPSSVINIGEGAFQDCSGLTNITIPSSVSSIGADAFESCSELTSISIPSSVSSIVEATFFGCTGLTSVTIPSSVTAVGDWAFGDCSGLMGVYFKGDAPSTFGSEVFENTAVGFSIYYPSTASGWSTPTWNGWPAQSYVYPSPRQQPLLTLILSSGTAIPSFSNLQPGTNYQLQVSTDLKVWTNTGAAFTATNASEAYAQHFNVVGWSELFFRLHSAP